MLSGVDTHCLSLRDGQAVAAHPGNYQSAGYLRGDIAVSCSAVHLILHSVGVRMPGAFSGFFLRL